MQRKPLVSVVDATEARQNFGQIIKRAYGGQEHLLIEKNGLPVVVILSVSDYQELRRAAAMQNLEELGQALGSQARARGLTPETLLQEEERIKREVFEELYGQHTLAR